MRQLVYVFCCVAFAACLLYAYIDQHNQLTVLQMKVPVLKKKLKAIEDEIALLQCEKEKFENPLHLMELASKPQFGHLKHPLICDVIIMNERQDDE